MLKSLFESSIDGLNIPSDMKDAIKKINNVCLEADETTDNMYKSVGKVAMNQGKFNQSVSPEQAKAMYDAQQKEKAAKEGKNDAQSQTQVAKADDKKEESAPKKEEKKDAEVAKKEDKQETKNSEVNASNNAEPPKDKDLGYTPLGEEDKKKAEKIKEDQKVDDEIKKYSIDNAKSQEDMWNILSELQKKAVAARGTDAGEKWRKKLEDEYWTATTQKNFKRVKGFEGTINNKGTQQQNTDAKAAETKTAEQPAQNTDGKAAEQPAQTASAQPAQNAEGQQAQTADGKSAEQPAAKSQGTPTKRGADVATVQYYLQSRLPNEKIVADGILGPKTIAAIQKAEDCELTGKMDSKTQESFKRLLDSAKKKVMPIQEKLGITADGLIGKETIAAMDKANIHPTNVFSENVKGEKYAAPKKEDVNVFDSPFNEKEANQLLASGNITKSEYGVWKAYGVSPLHQKTHPDEVQKQVARLARRSPSERKQNQEVNASKSSKEPINGRPFDEAQANSLLKQNSISQQTYDIWKQYNICPLFQKKRPEETKAFIAKAQNGGQQQPAVGQGNDKNVQQVAGNTKGPQNEAEKKFFDKTKENWTKVYAEKFKNNPERVEPAAEQQAKIELLKYRARMAQAARQNGQQQPQQVAAKGNAQPAQQQPQQVAAKGNAQPAQQGGQQKPASNDYYSKTTKNGVTTEQYGGSTAAQNADEEQFVEKRRNYYLETKYKKKPEDIAYERADNDARNDLLQYRLKKQGKMGA